MTTRGTLLGAPEWLIISGSLLFILALAVSAVFVPEIRWLHLFQALMYVSTVILSLRGSRWGYFVGVSTAGFWNYLLAFASPVFARFLETPARPDLALQVFAWLSNCLVIVGCVWAYSRRVSPSRGDILRFVAALGGTTGYLAAAIAACAPPYLRIFPALLHPHWPWVGA